MGDLESKEESNEATLPPLVQKLKSKQEINTEGPGIDEIKLESQEQLGLSSKEDSLKKSMKEDIVDIMKQVELMNETFQETDKKVPRKLKIAQGNTDGSRQEFEDTT